MNQWEKFSLCAMIIMAISVASCGYYLFFGSDSLDGELRVIHSSQCPYCISLLSMLDENGIDYIAIEINDIAVSCDNNYDMCSMLNMPVPQIYYSNGACMVVHIGAYDTIEQLDNFTFVCNP